LTSHYFETFGVVIDGEGLLHLHRIASTSRPL